jgi:hypothetical protein
MLSVTLQGTPATQKCVNAGEVNIVPSPKGQETKIQKLPYLRDFGGVE